MKGVVQNEKEQDSGHIFGWNLAPFSFCDYRIYSTL